jgi:TPR repeat protein/transcriptional regulator with XRE-family HTH domain
MNLAIGENIKRLRTKQGDTQEKLAEHLGITTRAVSKWECGKAYPDITLLPGIANFLGVTFDELMKSENGSDNEQRLMKLQIKLLDNMSQGRVDDTIKLLREAVKEFPSNYDLLVTLGGSLLAKDVHLRGLPEEPPEMRERFLEARGLFERVLEYCSNDKLRMAALTALYNVCQYLEDETKQRELYAQLPSELEFTTLLLIPGFINGDQRAAMIEQNIVKMADGLQSLILQLADIGSVTYGIQWTAKERLKILGKVQKLYDVIYENGDYGNATGNLIRAYATMARLEADNGDAEHAIGYFEKAVDYAVMQDTTETVITGNFGDPRLPYVPHSSILVSKVQTPQLLKSAVTESNACCNLLHISLEHSVFAHLVALLKDTDRYKAATAKLEAHAKAHSRPAANPFTIYLQGAEAGDINCMEQLAEMYDQGMFVRQDYAEAAKWNRKAAEGGHTAAAVNLGGQYEQGRGVAQDYQQAMYWYIKSDTVPNPFGVGNPWAKVAIGDLYKKGLGVGQSYAEAVKWYQEAEALIFPLAYYRLGECYENGWGVERSLVKALEYYEKAAKPDPAFKGLSLGELTSDDAANKAIARLKERLK